MTSVLGVTCETALPVRSSVIQQALKVLDNSTGQRPGRPCGNWNTSSSCLVSTPKALTGSWFSRSAIRPHTNRCSWLRPVSSLKPLVWNEKLLLLKLVFHLQVSQLSFILCVKHWAIKSLGTDSKKKKRKSITACWLSVWKSISDSIWFALVRVEPRNTENKLLRGAL